MGYVIALLLFLFGASPSVQFVQENTRGGLDPWSSPAFEPYSPKGVDHWEQESSESEPESETDTRGGLDPWG